MSKLKRKSLSSEQTYSWKKQGEGGACKQNRQREAPIAPGDGANQLRRLEVCKEIFVKDQGAWVPARLIRCRATDSRMEEGVDKAKNAASINSGRSAR